MPQIGLALWQRSERPSSKETKRWSATKDFGEGKVFWLRSQVQGCCAKVFSAVGVALPPLLALEPEEKRVAKNAADQSG